MNEQDREALDIVTELEASGVVGGDEATEAVLHLTARLDYTDKLERALAWRESMPHRITEFAAPEYYWALWKDTAVIDSEPHDGTPRGRGEALIRLWERVTGGKS